MLNPNLIPNKAPGTLFNSFTGGDQNLLVRYLQPLEPSYFEIHNRPIKDLEVRQLIISKAVDGLQNAYGSQFYYPFLTQPRVSSGTVELDVPLEWIWDMHMSIPENWGSVRLAKIKRMSGGNGTTGYDGVLRLIFTATFVGSSTEVAVMYADYNINNDLTYQLSRLEPVLPGEETVVLNADDRNRFSGLITFSTLDVQEQRIMDFFDLLAPPTNLTVGTNGYYVTPAVYEISDSVAGSTSITGDFDFSQVSHGTGLLTDSALNNIPSQVVSSQGLLDSLNYPFATDANLQSLDGVIIPAGLFSEFDICAPAGDEPTNDTSGTYYPVWVNRVQRLGTGNSQLRLYFATYNVTDNNPSTDPVEFAILDLLANGSSGDILPIVPLNNLRNVTGSNAALAIQHFGRGHVKLSDLWGSTDTTVPDFFNDMASLGSVDVTSFTKSSTRLAPMAISRVSKYIPSIGESRALAGTTARRTPAAHPSDTNRYVTEEDQGLGQKIDLDVVGGGLTPNAAIDRYGYASTLVHKTIKLCIDNSKVNNSDPTFYNNNILPRLRILLGRDPIFGDEWYEGTRFLRYNGDTWQSP